MKAYKAVLEKEKQKLYRMILTHDIEDARLEKQWKRVINQVRKNIKKETERGF
jgi:DNA-directed RNA polymerase beta' subunit